MKKTICLNMIVKDESHVIERCLESVKSIIDYWVIVDTGSQDGTQDIIKQFLKDIPGELHERPWVNFEHNRNEALSLALNKADYIFFIDADDRLVFAEDFALPELEADGYWMIQKEASGSFFKEHNIFCLMKNQADIRWEGVIHECLVAATPKEIRQLKGVFNEYINDGARSKDPEKHRKEAEILEKAVKDNPLNIRYPLHLGRAYGFLGDYDSALKHYEQATRMRGPSEDRYYALLNVALCQKILNYPSDMVINSFCQAYQFNPKRAEALYELANYYLQKENVFLAYLVTKKAKEIPQTTDNLFVEHWMYDWGASLLFLKCARWLQEFDEAYATLVSLLEKPTLPSSVREQLDQLYAEFPKAIA
jgi:glycosyltransferase involved in cell wall biosynthesis